MDNKNGVAVAGFVLALVSVIFFWVPVFGVLLVIAALSLSVVGLHRAVKQRRSHRGIAIAGLAIGVPFLALAVLLTVLVLTGGTTPIDEEPITARSTPPEAAPAEPTAPELRTEVCHDQRENAGLSYTYNPAEETYSAAVSRACGEIRPNDPTPEATTTSEVTPEPVTTPEVNSWDFEVTDSGPALSTPASNVITEFSYTASPRLIVGCAPSVGLVIGLWFPGGYVYGDLDGAVSVLGLFEDGKVTYAGLWVEAPPDYEVVTLIDEGRHHDHWTRNIRNSDLITVIVLYGGDGTAELEAEMEFDVRGFHRAANNNLSGCY